MPRLDDPGDECYNELADKGYIVETLTAARSEEGQSVASWVDPEPQPTAAEIYERFSNE